MQARKAIYTDLLLTVLAPLCLGICCYIFYPFIKNISWLSSHLADACWAFAFTNALLIVWHRKPVAGWLLMAAGTAVFYEYCQYKGWLAGTGDIIDIITYLLAGMLALLVNNFILKKIYLSPAKTTIA